MVSVGWLENKFYEGFVPTKYMYNDIVRGYANKETIALDFGAGRGVSYVFEKGDIKKVYGVDVDPAIKENLRIDEGHIISNDKLPFEDNTFDIVYSTYVAEHLSDPEATFREINRVLKPGGIFIFLTISKYHYVALIATLTPLRFHKYLINKIRRRQVKDVFPTAYKANSAGQIKRISTGSNFNVKDIIHRESPPNYLAFTVATFAIGIIYERLVKNVGLLKQCRSGLIAILEKHTSS